MLLYGVASHGYNGLPVTVCALFAQNEGFHFQILHTLSFLVICYFRQCNLCSARGSGVNWREFLLTALYGVAVYGYFGRPVTNCAQFAPNEDFNFQILHTLIFLVIFY